jgi:hypothetical protein
MLGMISLEDYFMGRRETHPTEISPGIERNAFRTVEIINTFLPIAKVHGVTLEIHPRTRTIVSSGWRPPTLNAATPNAAFRSLHMTGEAIDLFDPDGDLDNFCMSPSGNKALVDLGLWLEHPSATKGWCHLQTRPPRSGRRVFYP